MSVIVQGRLLDIPLVGLYPVGIGDANRCLVEWGHRLGPVFRPFRQEAYGFEVDGALVAVAISGSIVHGPVAAAWKDRDGWHVPFEDRPEGYARNEVVELTRLAAAESWMSRIMLRLWREVCAPRWKSWPVRAAVSYSHNAMHRGDLYRFDGWEKVREDAGSSGGGTWSRKRKNTDAVFGKKTLWMWRYAITQEEERK